LDNEVDGSVLRHVYMTMTGILVPGHRGIVRSSESHEILTMMTLETQRLTRSVIQKN